MLTRQRNNLFLKIILIIILISSFLPESLISQKENNNWYFGNSCGITFSTPDGKPEAVSGGQIYSEEGCSSISDSTGKLLFYTNGINVYDSGHSLMTGGANLNGHRSSTQSSLIVKKPGNNNLFYIFTCDAHESKTYGLRYSIVDMDLNAGNGSVIEKNKALKSNIIEQIAAVYHENCEDYWVSTYDYIENKFYSFLLTKNGIDDTVITVVKETKYSLGMAFKFSPKGDMAAISRRDMSSVDSPVEVWDFDNSTGIFSNPIRLNGYDLPYGIEFSPDGTKIYVSDWSKGILNQYETGFSNEQDYNNSKVEIANGLGRLGAIQAGPDKKLYLNIELNSDLRVINNPNEKGVACNFNSAGLDFDIYRSRLGLPNFPVRCLKYHTVTAANNSELCEGDTLRLFANIETSFNNSDFQWFGPNNYQSSEQNPVIPNTTPNMSGWYKIIASSDNMKSSDSTYVTIHPKPEFNILPDNKLLLCRNDSLFVTLDKDFVSYSWSTGEKTKSIHIYKPGNYSVEVSNINGCKESKSFNVTEIDLTLEYITPEFDLGTICIGDSISGKTPIFNNNIYDLNINRIIPVKMDNNISATTSSGTSFLLPANKQIDVFINATPGKLGIVRDTLTIEIAYPCTVSFLLPLKINVKPNIKTWLPDTDISFNKNTCLPIMAKLNTTNSNKVSNLAYDAEIVINADIFLPKKQYNYTTEVVSPGVYNIIINLSGTGITITEIETKIGEICGTTLLSDNIKSPYTLRSITWTDPEICYDTASGILTRDSVCNEAVRKIRYYTPPEISIVPSPADDEIEIVVKGITDKVAEIKIYSVDGIEKKTIDITLDGSEQVHKFNIDLSSFAVGLYQVVLVSNSSILQEQFIIIK